MKRKNENNISLILSMGMFAIPVALSTFIQRLFNVIDTMVAGKLRKMLSDTALLEKGVSTDSDPFYFVECVNNTGIQICSGD